MYGLSTPSNGTSAFIPCISTCGENSQLPRDSLRVECGLSMKSQTTIHVQVMNFIFARNQGNQQENEN